jgi:hypothetical protein
MRALQAKSDIGGSIYRILHYRILPHSTESQNLSPKATGWRMPKGGNKNCGELRRAMII